MRTTAESSRRAVARRPASPSGHSRHFQTVRRMSAYEPNSGRIADTPRPPLGPTLDIQVPAFQPEGRRPSGQGLNLSNSTRRRERLLGNSLFNGSFHPRRNHMRSFSRIAVMVIVSLLTLTICGGGYTDRNAFGFVGLLLVMFWGLPLIGLITLFHFLDRRFGPYARYPIALIGLFPLLLVIYFGGQGDAIYMRAIVLSGLAWSAAWLATFHIFSRVARQPRGNLLGI
jgi:hypothetical protein